MRDGSYMPRPDAVESRREKVDKIAKQKGWDDPSSLYFEEPLDIFLQEPEEGSGILGQLMVRLGKISECKAIKRS